ncbi:hypothetical protein E6H26_00560 [Candidatus Bathyarchaeota archaeon]|nr:MAG: hypothetical protein E6H26_00560 [Candidatus Bathyarchaeota archaeon]
MVQLISTERRPEEALDLLSEHYVHRDKTIYISSQEYLYDPYVLIHEFYHHLRNVGGKHRGTERHAKEFALSFLKTG